MKISTLPTVVAPSRQLPAAEATEPTAAPDQFSPSGKPKVKKYEPWVPFANAALVGALVGVPSALGAVENQLFGPAVAGALTAFVTPVVAGLGAAAYTFKGANKEFNGPPILVGGSTIIAGVVAGAAAPFLKAAGAAWGWQGAAIATGVAATLTGVISAVAIHKANQAADKANQA